MNPAENFQHDRRMIVLVLLGLCICLPHLYGTLGPVPDCRDQAKVQPRIVWFETVVAQGSGLYWLEASSGTWQGMFAALGFHSLAESLPLGGDAVLSAYRLQANGQLQAISPPAQADPIFFQPIPINQASLETLMVIPGIGRRLAASIIAYRDRAGGIADRASLLAIEGIGEKKAASIAGYVRFE
jgi:DNA uptake protein ComE-like DNA-binding protein